MQQLSRDMLSRYDIPIRSPKPLRIVQFGLTDALLGIADRLLEEGNGPDIACAASGDRAALLTEQDGLYTLLVRGYRGDAPVEAEVVIQSLRRIVGEGTDLDALALAPNLMLALVDTASEALETELRQAARLLSVRHSAGLPGLAFLCLGERADGADRVRDALAALLPDLSGWLLSDCAFYPALAEGFARRADADEAARQCRKMNYADGMLHLAEPFARLTIQAPAALAGALGLAPSERLSFTGDLSPALARKRRLFDGALFAMVAPGWLLGCDTLRDCMAHERLRDFVGRACYGELLPADPDARAAAAPYAIECFERFENPLHPTALLDAGRGLLGRFARGVLPLMRAWADEHFEPPRLLSFALAATIMLYAGARPNAEGVYEVARTGATRPLFDDESALAGFAALSHDMDPAALAYAALADRELWGGADLRDIDGLEARVALDLAAMQRDPSWLP